MNTETNSEKNEETMSFYERPGVQVYQVDVGKGVPVGIERISHPEIGIGGAYAGWGDVINNEYLPLFIEERLGEPLGESEKLDLSTLGFVNRFHTPVLSDEEHIELEVDVGARLLRESAEACGWEPQEVDAVLIGMTAPITGDYLERITRRAGIPDEALKVSVHKACDGSVGALQVALNPALDILRSVGRNISQELMGKRVLVGGVEGLSRYMNNSRDKIALQMFGNGAGVIGVIPGKTIKYLIGKAYEVYDELGVLAVTMVYPHSRKREVGKSMIETTQPGPNLIRLAGLMHEPTDGAPVHMAGLMGMVKLFVRNGVQVVREVYEEYKRIMPDHPIQAVIAHHANFKINSLMVSHLQKEGINLSMPWLIKEFGNVSAASNMIAFLRHLPNLTPGDAILIDGFGAGTYYDVLAVKVG